MTHTVCQFFGRKWIWCTLVFPLRKVEQRQTKMHWDYLKRWTNFRRQLSKSDVTPKINFCKNKEIRQNSPETALVWFFVISLTSSGHSNKSCMHWSTQKPIFIFWTSILRYQRFMSFKKALPLYQLFFTLYDVWNAFWQCFRPFELRSCLLRQISDVWRYNYILICVYYKAWIPYAIKVNCSQLAL